MSLPGFTTAPVFGDLLRGARLGYRWLPRISAFVRIDGDGPPWEVEVVAPGRLPSHPRRGRKHVVWWEGDESGEELLSHLAFWPEAGHVYVVDEMGCLPLGEPASEPKEGA